MLSPFPFLLLLLLTFPNLIFGQISLSDPISSGTSCIPEVTSAGLQLTCSVMGFFVVDALPQSYTTSLNFQIISQTTLFGVGLGQRPDSTCRTSMFPQLGLTWATCPPSAPSGNVPCNTNDCYFNRATIYSATGYRSKLGPLAFGPPAQQNLQLQSFFIYQWKFQPPTCPLDPSYPNNKCWQVTYSRKTPSASAWVKIRDFSASNTCDALALEYIYSCDSPSKYAVYIELEAAGEVVILFSPPTACTTIPNCLSCTDPSICDYCEQNYLVGFSKSTCLFGCPVLSSPYFTHCKCQPNTIPSSSNECVCNPSRHLTFDTTLQVCECLPGYYPDSGFVVEPPLFGTITFTGTQNCLPCNSSCMTCSGPDVNQCLTCPSGYFLTSKKICEEIPKEDYELDSASKAGNVGKTISTVGMIASTVASAGSSEAVRTSLVGKMFKYLRYLDITYPKNLRNLLHSKPSDFLSAKTGIKVPESLEDEESYDRAPAVYRRYIELPSSFLVNFWEDLLMLLVLSAATLLVYFVDFFVKRGNRSTKKKTAVENISGKVSILAQSFLIIYMYKDGGDVIFFQILDFRTMNGYSGAEIMNPFASIIFLMITISLIGFHYYTISRYQAAKSSKNNSKALESFTEKKENLQIFWKDYKDPLLIQQSFLLILVVRDIMYNFMLGLLFEYPLIQTLLFPCYSFITLAYIFIGRPFKRILDNIQHFIYEILLLIVYICVMILAIMDSVGSQDKTTRDNLGKTVIVVNCLFNFTPTVFIVLKVAFLGYEYYQEKNMKKKRRGEPVKIEDDLNHEQSNMSMIELIKGRKSLEISQVDFNGGTGSIFYQENSLQMMDKPGIEYHNSQYGGISSVTSPYNEKEVNRQMPIIDQQNSGIEEINVRPEEKTGDEANDIVFEDVEEDAGKVKGEPIKRRKIKKVKHGN